MLLAAIVLGGGLIFWLGLIFANRHLRGSMAFTDAIPRILTWSNAENPCQRDSSQCFRKSAEHTSQDTNQIPEHNSLTGAQ